MDIRTHPLYHTFKLYGVTAPDDEFEQYLSLWKPRTVKKKEMLLRQGQIARQGLYVVKGCLRKYMTHENGKEQVVYFAEEGWLTGDLVSMRGNTPTVYSIQAMEDGEVLTLSKEDWEYCYNTWSWWRDAHMRIQHKRVVKLQEEMVNALNETADIKYARLVKERPGLLQRLPQYHIAAFLGISPEALSRIRAKMSGF